MKLAAFVVAALLTLVICLLFGLRRAAPLFDDEGVLYPEHSDFNAAPDKNHPYNRRHIV